MKSEEGKREDEIREDEEEESRREDERSDGGKNGGEEEREGEKRRGSRLEGGEQRGKRSGGGERQEEEVKESRNCLFQVCFHGNNQGNESLPVCAATLWLRLNSVAANFKVRVLPLPTFLSLPSKDALTSA